MRPYFKLIEFWQCVLFLVWPLFDLTVLSLHFGNVSVTGRWLGRLLLITGALFLIAAFTVVVKWRIENPDRTKSPVVRVFLYTAGTLVVALQTVLYVLRTR